MRNMQALLGLFMLIVSANCMFESNSAVVQLTPSNFDKLVLNGDEVWIVEFYAPWCGHCQSFASAYASAASALKGIVKVGAVNADDHQSLAQKYGVKGFPTVKIFTGPNKNKPQDYNGRREASDVVDAALNAARKQANDALGGKRSDSGYESRSKSSSDDVIELTDANFKKLVLDSEDMWLVEFFAPWCGHCKKLAPVWASAATELKGKVKLGALDATVHTITAQRYSINGYPTIKYFPSGKKTEMSAEDYTGGRSQSDIVSWALDNLAANLPAPEINQLTDEQVLMDACDEKPLCIIAVLPHILDCQSSCRNDYLNVLKTLSEKYKQKMWGWVWAQARSQIPLEDALEIGGFGYPALAAVNAKKMKFLLFRGSFSENGLNSFFRELSYGTARGIAPIKGAQLPKIIKVDAWDGKDGELPQEEDMDDLNEKDEL